VLLAVGSLSRADPSPVVHYAPAGNLEHIDVELIDSAKHEIDFAAYVLTDWPVMQALIRAADRGVKVRIYLDGTQFAEPATVFQDLADTPGVEIRVKSSHGAPMHLKSYQIDGRVSTNATSTKRAMERAVTRADQGRAGLRAKGGATLCGRAPLLAYSCNSIAKSFPSNCAEKRSHGTWAANRPLALTMSDVPVEKNIRSTLESLVQSGYVLPPNRCAAAKASRAFYENIYLKLMAAGTRVKNLN
jgi:hypothetical protein